MVCWLCYWVLFFKTDKVFDVVVQQSSQRWIMKKPRLWILSQQKRVARSPQLKTGIKNISHCLELFSWILIYILLRFMVTDSDRETHSIDLSRLQKKVALCGVQDNFSQDRSYIDFPTTKNCRWPSRKWNAHFLVNRPVNSLPPGKFDRQDSASFKSWKNVQQMVNHFSKRLVKEYLPTHLKRSRWKMER